MTAATYIFVMIVAWIALLAAVIAIFHAQRWLDDVIDDELNAIAPAPCGPDMKGQREER